MKKVLQGNEAIARGAYEAGVAVAAAYPGTPSSEILAEIAKYPQVYAEWSPNEKVALEVAAARLRRRQGHGCMKHVGMNVASDPFMTLPTRASRVVSSLSLPTTLTPTALRTNRTAVTGRESPRSPCSSRETPRSARTPPIAFEMSERFETPVLLKGTTRISHADSLVEEEERKETGAPLGLDRKEIPKRAMVPVFVRARRKFVEERMRKLEAYADEFPYNRMELNDPG